METRPTPPGLHRLRRFALVFLALVVAFGAFGYFAGPPIARSVLAKTLSKELHRPVTVGDIDINPYAMTARIANLTIGAPGDGAAGETAGFDELFVDLDIASIFHAAPIVEELRLAGLRVHLAQETPGRYNISDLLDEWLKPSDAPPPRFSVNNIRITGGRIEFDDRPVGKRHTVTDINLSLPFISNLPHQAHVFTEPAFSANIDGAPLALAGKSRPFAEVHESELQLDLDRFELSRYLAYSPVALPFTATGGHVDTDIRLLFRQAPNEPATLSLTGKVNLRDLHLIEQGQQPLLNLARLDIPITAVAPLESRYQFGAIAIDGLETFVRVDRAGNLNWLSMARQLAGGGNVATKPDTAKPAKPVAWSIDGVRLVQGAVHWQDESNPKPMVAHATGIDVAVGKVDSELAAPIDADLALAIDAAPHASLGRFEVKSARVDLVQQRINVGNLLLRGLRLAATRETDGRIASLQPPALKTAASASATENTGAAARPNDAGPAWTMEIAHGELADASLRFDDKAVTPAASHSLDITRLALENFSTAPKAPASVELAARINKKGSLQANGTVQLAPVAGKLKVDLRGVELLPLQPYFGDRLNVTITKGQVSGKGEMALSQAADGSLGGGYRGQVTVGHFHSVDKANSTDFLTWKSFHLGKMDVALKPFSLAIGDVALTDFFARLIVSPEGKLNLLQIVKQETAEGVGDRAAPTPAAKDDQHPPARAAAPAPSAPAAPPSAPPPPIRIDQVTLQGGLVSITDNFIKPNYSANLTDIGGRITGLSSATDSTADIDLRGAYDGAPVTIAGKLNPLAATPSLDIKAEVRGIELTALSPYSGKYAGYAIDKGKLSLFLGYQIADGKLQADNRIFLDQLTFGQKIESPDATKLPVTLAVSLLQNRRGEIDINLPISGSLNDPEFSVGGIIVQVIVNLLTKAITAPFALLGSLFGGGEELSHVDFAAGRALLAPTALKRLESLAKALDDRPGLKLDITGRVDPEKDREGLRQATLEHKVKAQKLAQLVKEGKEVGSASEVTLDEKDYLPMLEQAYKQEKFPKPRNFIGMAKSLPREEMEKLMLANAQVGDEELRDLATRRAKAVADWLGTAGKIPRERIFLLPPKLAADGSGPKDAPLERAEFSLK
jgi:hypothetical protein